MTRVRAAAIVTVLVAAIGTVAAVEGMASATGSQAGAMRAAAAPAVDTLVTPTTAHGTGFQIHPMLDTSFCMDVENGATQARSVTLSQCTAILTQRWAFPWNSDKSNLLVETQGMCVDGRNPQLGVTAKVRYCRSTNPWKYVFTPTGQIQNVSTGQCLTFTRVAAGAPVYFDVCDAGNQDQFWKLSQ